MPHIWPTISPFNFHLVVDKNQSPQGLLNSCCGAFMKSHALPQKIFAQFPWKCRCSNFHFFMSTWRASSSSSCSGAFAHIKQSPSVSTFRATWTKSTCDRKKMTNFVCWGWLCDMIKSSRKMTEWTMWWYYFGNYRRDNLMRIFRFKSFY